MDKAHILEVHPHMQQYKATFKVTVEEHEITFEEDEEGYLRAIGDIHHSNTHGTEPGLLEEIARRIVEAVNQ
ncbi:hypothetical protein SAMN05518672_1011582 [Chitinophaga sp. CF118]|uniref:hypothetical protein n=1 Tax=Chitinophaga sp. CF118 TaxID=1884367 RepID=UPI0008E95684|nr:hypothetical protein [Chitinophaga sp. CF118]SFD31433.1 hypothetical protein SAMN05518672_1011582 [Chitinophaga sp. CF118]